MASSSSSVSSPKTSSNFSGWTLRPKLIVISAAEILKLISWSLPFAFFTLKMRFNKKWGTICEPVSSASFILQSLQRFIFDVFLLFGFQGKVVLFQFKCFLLIWYSRFSQSVLWCLLGSISAISARSTLSPIYSITFEKQSSCALLICDFLIAPNMVEMISFLDIPFFSRRSSQLSIRQRLLGILTNLSNSSEISSSEGKRSFA
ncbi:hypothetical protein D3C85_1340640 [compost metagenome]